MIYTAWKQYSWASLTLIWTLNQPTASARDTWFIQIRDFLHPKSAANWSISSYPFRIRLSPIIFTHPHMMTDNPRVKSADFQTLFLTLLSINFTSDNYYLKITSSIKQYIIYKYICIYIETLVIVNILNHLWRE